MKIGVLTGGGDTAALNATLQDLSIYAFNTKKDLIGFRYGWKGVLEKDIEKLDCIDGSFGGTEIKTSRTKLKDSEIDIAAKNIEELVDCFIAIGGDDTLSVGRKFSDKLKIPFCLITKTIDNDVGINAPKGNLDLSKMMNYFTPGFPTACERIKEYTSQLRTTAYSHDRIIILEAMGRQPGWLALASFKSDPDFIIVPEVSLDYEIFKEKVAKRYEKSKNVLIVVAEGAKYFGNDKPISEDEHNIDSFGHKKLGGVAQILAERLKKDLKIENCNSVNPNYLYRSGNPSEIDFKIANRLGLEAIYSVIRSETNNVAVVQRCGNELKTVIKPIEDIIITDSDGKIIPRTLDLRFYDAKNYSITPEGIEYFTPIFSDKRDDFRRIKRQNKVMIYDEGGSVIGSA